MADTLGFEALLKAAADDDTEKLEGELEKLESERDELNSKLDSVKVRISTIETTLAVPLKKALKAARELGIEVPEQYRTIRTGSNSRSAGRYLWHSQGITGFQAEPSRAMWRLSRGSDGSGGSNGEGILLVDEFWALVKEQAQKTEADIEPGEKVTVKLPNDREVTLEKVKE